MNSSAAPAHGPAELDALREVTRIVATLAHEANSPASAVVAFAALLREEPDMPQGELADVLDHLDGGAQRIGRILRQIQHVIAHPGRYRFISLAEVADALSRRRDEATRIADGYAALQLVAEPEPLLSSVEELGAQIPAGPSSAAGSPDGVRLLLPVLAAGGVPPLPPALISRGVTCRSVEDRSMVVLPLRMISAR